ncbi:YqiA/YcfP family alpha/beta fold hydrolase [Bacteroides pyogenes]|uniref:YqiA/YcfP family alpha/beta fold hydrolase n=1 Tax=Bacteroides pyogenes TaxID=310300 RepID=UPI002FDA9BF1
MKKILFLHGFTSSGSCDMALALREALVGEARVIAPDLPLYPEEAVALIEREIRIHRPQLVVGSSCGGFYARMFVSAHRKVILINPYFAMTEFLQTRIGTHRYKSPRADHRQEFKVTQRLVEHFRMMETVQFTDYTSRHKRYVYGLFGTQDTLAHFRPVYDRVLRSCQGI